MQVKTLLFVKEEIDQKLDQISSIEAQVRLARDFLTKNCGCPVDYLESSEKEGWWWLTCTICGKSTWRTD